MTELIRPMLYQAYHQIENLSRKGHGPWTIDHGLKYDVVGPICESTDCFQKDVSLPESFRGDLIAVRTAGAYGEVMASGYNLRDRVGSVYSE
jgi:diaminopimelate decarboxylase